jgi:hypothetical protein
MPLLNSPSNFTSQFSNMRSHNRQPQFAFSPVQSSNGTFRQLNSGSNFQLPNLKTKNQAQLQEDSSELVSSNISTTENNDYIQEEANDSDHSNIEPEQSLQELRVKFLQGKRSLDK